MNQKVISKELLQISDLLVEDIMKVSDEEILKEHSEKHGDPKVFANKMRDFVHTQVMATRKHKLAEARASLSKHKADVSRCRVIDVATARIRLQSIKNDPAFRGLTLAARNESTLSDDDILGILEEMEALGIIFPDDKATSK